ncbi:45 kDa calcium-binding protein-like [Scleropages formosus]|uniref:45 kDa calcium-binding protein n=1 Tax=Scleropages formosus TaxID=113540 RepID=A0A0P7UJX4_SCLFO|nr:45 kDa calcium-binding protein-like [Scleropages formosus]
MFASGSPSLDASPFCASSCVFTSWTGLDATTCCCHPAAEAMLRGGALRRRSGRGFLASLALLALLAVTPSRARPANVSSLKDKSPSSKEDNEILPPDHLNGVKMEMDGHLNKDFHQEVFLGKEMEEFEEDSEPRRNRKKLIEIFSKVDINKDRSISAKEMQRWIMEKTEEHFQEAVRENKLSFRAVDPDGDGHVTWDEYRVKFLASKGFNEKEVAEKIKKNEELKVDEETQEVLESLKDRWFQADNPPADQLLNEQEFLSFLHPEHSRGMLKYMVKEIVRDLEGHVSPKLDQDGDKKLTLSEFISLPMGTVENQHGQEIDDDWVKERKKEFQEVIDANKDGIVTMEELEEYMDPMNEYNALNEAKQMIAVADENQNHNLELEEILKYSEYFTGSKLMDYARNVHEEF